MNQPFCFTMAECILKHIDISEPFRAAILNEIALKNPKESLGIFFQLFVKCNNISKDLWNLYMQFIDDPKVINGFSDLILLNKIDITLYEHVFDCYDENTVVPLSKLLLARKLTAPKYVKMLLVIFYSTENELILQYLSCFFYEYFKNDSTMLILVYCDVLEEIETSHRIFTDQALYWISNDQKASESFEKLFYAISIYIFKNYECLKSKTQLFKTFERIEINKSWNKNTIKKLIYIFACIIRKRPKENAQMILHRLIELDDGIPLAKEEIYALDEEMR